MNAEAGPENFHFTSCGMRWSTEKPLWDRFLGLNEYLKRSSRHLILLIIERVEAQLRAAKVEVLLVVCIVSNQL